MRKKATLLGILMLLVVVCAELFARYYLGLGDPPIAEGDAEIDYIFAANQDCNRFGNRIVYNDAAMRCDFNVLTRGGARRLFVVGDSIINGGVLTDHKYLATTLLQELFDPSREKIQVCNVSAGSWGPGNYAAYFRKYHELVSTNDVLVLEVNSHDLWEDDPAKTAGRNVGKDVALPDHKPWCALWDGFDRYLMPRIRRLLGKAQVSTKVDVPKWQTDAENEVAKYNLRMLDDVFKLPFEKKYILIHRSRQESKEHKETPGESGFRNFAEERAIPVIELALEKSDYRDKIHLSISGQRKMAETIEKHLHDLIKCHEGL